MELTYGCNSSIKDLNEGAKEENKDYTFGGMVVNFESRPSKRGGNYGRLTIEDYTGSTELMLFDKDYINFSKYGTPSAQLYITGRYRRGYNGELRFGIQRIDLLNEVKGKLINAVTIKVALADINDTLQNLLQEQITRSSENRGILRFEVYNPEINRSVTLRSGLPIPIDKNLIKVLDDLELEYEFGKLN